MSSKKILKWLILFGICFNLAVTPVTVDAQITGAADRQAKKDIRRHPTIKVTITASPSTLTLPATTSLKGTVTVVSTESPVAVTWTKTSGTGTVTFGNTHAVTTSAAFSKAGTYILTLTATTSRLSASASVTVTVLNGAVPVNMAWDAVSDPYLVGYNVYRSTTSGVFSGPPLNNTPQGGTTYSDNTVITGHTYYYIVRSVNTAATESGNSNQVSATR